VESGLFKELQRKKIKKSPGSLTRVSGCRPNASRSSALSFYVLPVVARVLTAPRVSISRKYTEDSGFRQRFVCRDRRVAQEYRFQQWITKGSYIGSDDTGLRAGHAAEIRQTDRHALLDKSVSAQLSREAPSPQDQFQQEADKLNTVLRAPPPSLLQQAPVGVSVSIYFDSIFSGRR
jgi:hypothetical protein